MAGWVGRVRGSRVSLLGVAFGLLLLIPRAGQASTITFTFQGNATGIGATDMDPALIGVTVPFSGTFTLDDTDLNANTSLGQYGCTSSGCPGWTLEVLGLQVAGSTATATLNVGGSLVINLTGVTTPGYLSNSFVLLNLFYGAGFFGDDSLPGAIPFPIGSQSSRIQLARSPGFDYYFFPVMLTPLADPTPVPEPGSMLLLGTGLLVVARRVARSRRA